MNTTVQHRAAGKTTNQRNYAYCNEAIGLKTEGERMFLELGERLYKIRKDELFKPSWQSFYEYELEFKWSPGTANKLINIYKVFVLEAKISPAKLAAAGGWTSLAETLPVIKNAKDAEHWLGQATELTRKDLRTEVKEAKHGISEDDACKHPAAQTYYLRICSSCGHKEQFYPEGKVQVRGPQKVEIIKAARSVVAHSAGKARVASRS